MAKLQKIKNNWYLTDTNFAPNEGSAVLFNNIPTYASFIDELNELCIVTIDGMTKNVGFEDIEVIIASSKYDTTLLLLPIDIQKAIANLFVFPTIGGEFGVNYPDEDDSVMGYYETKTEARSKIYDWFLNNKTEIIRHSNYECEYEIINEYSIEIINIKVIE